MTDRVRCRSLRAGAMSGVPLLPLRNSGRSTGTLVTAKRLWVIVLALGLLGPARPAAAETGGTPMDIIKPLVDARRLDEAESTARDVVAPAGVADGGDSVGEGDGAH